MTNPFKYGRIFDTTIIHLIVAMVIVLPFTVSYCSRSSTELHTERRALIQSGTLITDSVGTGKVSLNRGDSVTLLGVVDPDETNRPYFWVQTDRGYRGYLPQECITDSAYVDCRSLNFRKDTVTFSAVHNGEPIRVHSLTMNEHDYVKESRITLATGKDTVVRGHPYVFVLSDSLANDYTVSRYSDNMEPMSLGRFEKRYMGKKFDEIERDLTPALLVAPMKTGLQAQYPVLIAVKGEFYKPIIDFDADSVAVSYKLPGRANLTKNNWVNRYIPFFDKLQDLPMVGAIWTNGIYDKSPIPISQEKIHRLDLNGFSMKTLWAFILFIALVILLIMYALLPPMLLPYLCFGLTRFPIVYKHIDNNTLHRILWVMTWVLVIGWVLATLSNFYIILTVIGEFIVVSIFFSSLNSVLDRSCPEVRCSLCKTLYSTSFTERVEEGERRNAIEEVEHVLDRVVTSVERWQTYDEVTTTYGDGSKRTHKENIKNHSAEHGYNVVGVYMEQVVYIPYVSYYTCAECGGQERAYDEERQVLSRQKIRQYQSHF